MPTRWYPDVHHIDCAGAQVSTHDNAPTLHVRRLAPRSSAMSSFASAVTVTSDPQDEARALAASSFRSQTLTTVAASTASTARASRVPITPAPMMPTRSFLETGSEEEEAMANTEGGFTVRRSAGLQLVTFARHTAAWRSSPDGPRAVHVRSGITFCFSRYSCR